MNEQQFVRMAMVDRLALSALVPLAAGSVIFVSAAPAQARPDIDAAAGREWRRQMRLDRLAARNDQTDSNRQARIADRINDSRILQSQLTRFTVTDTHRISRYTDELGRTRALRNGVSFDLSSVDANVTVGSKLLGLSQLSIDVGGSSKQISAGTQVTAAEFAALNQKLLTGEQGLQLSESGSAVGGSVNLNVVSDGGAVIRTSSFQVPENVAVVGDFSKRSEGLRVNHDLVNSGSIYAVSSGNSREAIVSARDISNLEGGLISTVVPESVSSQFGTTQSNLDLALRAERNLSNDGTIRSSGNLELTAGGLIDLGSSSIVSANDNVRINAASMRNSGLVSSELSDINIGGAAAPLMTIDNTNGVFTALSGNINIVNADAQTRTNTNVIGGDWHSKELNIDSGAGDVAGNVGDVTGLLNVTACSIQFHATSETLLMGRMNATGDPLLSNAGNLIIAANQITNGAPLSIIAGGNITVGGGVTQINTSPASGNGGDVLIVAGALFTVPSDLEITGGTATGGNVNLTGITTFQTNGVGSSGGSGDITIVAFPGAGTGSITAPGAFQATAGAGGTRGAFTVIGGATAGAAINLGSVSVGSEPQGGNITIAAAAPVIVGGPVVIETTAGATQGQVLSGSFGVGTASNGTIQLSAVLGVNNNNVNISGGSNISLFGNVTGGNLLVNAGGNLILGDSAGDLLNGAVTVDIQSKGTITQFAGNTINGGALNVQFGSGATTLQTNVVSVSTDAAGLSLVINESNAIQLLGQKISFLTVNTTSGDITTGANISGLDSITLNSLGTARNIILTKDISVNFNGDVVLSAGNTGDIIQSGGSLKATNIGTLTVALNGASPGVATLLNTGNFFTELSGVGGGTVSLNNGSAPIALDSLGASQTLELTTTNSGSGISLTQAIDTTGTLTLNAPRISVSDSIKAASITVNNLTGDLSVVGSATAVLTGTTPAAGGAGTPSVPAAIIFNTAPTGLLTLSNNITFNGDVAFNNDFGTTTSLAGSTFTGNNNITLTTNNWVQQGAPPQITATNLIVNLNPFGTIINTAGSVTLNSGVTTINGNDFAIIASGDVNLGAITVNLSNANGSGGNLTIIAGAAFTPSSGGQTQSGKTFTFNSFGAGDVNASNATLNTSATGASGDAGTVVVVAKGGTINLGTVDSSSASGKGSAVVLVAEEGISISDAVTTGATGNGTLVLDVSAPGVSGIPTVANGTISGGSFFGLTGSAGNITIGDANLGTGVISASTDGAASKITIDGNVQASNLSLSAGSGVVHLSNSTLSALPNSGFGGTISVSASNLTSPAAPVILDASGSVRGGNVNLSLTRTSPLTLGTDLIVDASSPVDGGSAFIITGGDLNIGLNGVDVGGDSGNGGFLTFIAGKSGNGILTLTDKTFLSQAQPQGASGSGGRLSFSAPSIVTGSTSTSPLVLDVAGTGTGSSGQVSFVTTDLTPTFIGSPAKSVKGTANFLEIFAQSGDVGGNGNFVTVSVGGALTVNTDKLLVGPRGANGSGSDITLVSGGALIINGTLDATGVGSGTDRDVTLSSNSKTTFSIGATKSVKNGIFGAVKGETLDLRNNGGGITVATTNGLEGDVVFLRSSLKGAIATGKGAVIKAASLLQLTSDTGVVGKKDMLVESPIVQVSSGGNVSLLNQFTGATLLSSSTGGKLFSFKSAGILSLQGIATTGGDIFVSGGTGGALSLLNSGKISATDGSVTLVNPDINSGTISIGNNAIVETSGKKGDDVVIAIGTPPKKGVNTATPAGVNQPNLVDGGKAFFEGPVGSIVGVGPTNATINAIGKTVLISNASLDPGTNKISLGSAATITADPPVKFTTAQARMLRAGSRRADRFSTFVLVPASFSDASSEATGSLRR